MGVVFFGGKQAIVRPVINYHDKNRVCKGTVVATFREMEQRKDVNKAHLINVIKSKDKNKTKKNYIIVYLKYYLETT